MHELSALLSLELRSLYGLNKLRFTKDKQEKNRFYLLAGAFAVLIVTVFVYVGGLVYGLCSLGLHSIVPAYLTALASLLILAFGLFTAGARIFGQKGYDLLASMPIRTKNLVLSRFLSLYAEDLVLTLVIWIPGAAVYGFCRQPGPGFYAGALGAIVCIPAIPLVISALLGTLVFALSARMRHKSLVQSLLMVAVVVGILVISFGMGTGAENLSPEAFAQLAQTIGALLGRVYPPALWVNDGLLGTTLWRLLLFALVSAGVLALAILVTVGSFHGILQRLGNFTARHDYRLGTQESRGLLKALYLRELRRYFSSSVYVTNTIVGPILAAVMAVSLCFTGLESIRAAIPVDIPGLLPFVLAAVFCMMTTSCTSISMEGKQFDTVKSLPIPTKALLDSKILLNLSLMLPFYLISVTATAIAVRADAMTLLWLVLIPAAIALFSVVFGITVNLKFHSFDWEKEETVVKQSLPASLGGFSGFLVAAALGFAAYGLPTSFANLGRAAMCLGLLALTALLYRKNNRTDLRML